MNEQNSHFNPPDSDAVAALHFAIEKAESGELDRAIQDVRALIDRYPSWFDPRGHLAGMFIVRGRYDDALDQYEVALQLDPGNPYAASMAAWLCMERLDFRRAEAYLQSARLDDSTVSQSIIQQRETLAANLAKIRYFPRHPWLAYLLIWGAEIVWFLRARQWAIQWLKLAVTTQYRTPTLLERLGGFLSAQHTYDYTEKYRTSAAFLHEALRLNIRMGRIHERLAEIAWKRGDDEDAIAEAHRALELEPASLNPLHILALAHSRRVEPAEAAPLYDRLIDLSPSDLYLFLNRCAVSLQLQDYDSARQMMERAEELDSENPLLLFLCDIINESTGLNSFHGTSRQDNSTYHNQHSIQYGAPWLYGSGLTRKFKRLLKKIVRLPTGTIRQFLAKQHFHHVPCAVCAGDEYTHLCFCSGNGWRIVRCRTCGLVYIQPQPHPEYLYGIYQQDYWDGARSIGAEEFHQRAAMQNILQEVDIPLFRRLEQIGFQTWAEALGPHRRALDVGCGSGIFMRELLNQGWNVEGVEVAEDVVDFCQRMGLVVRQGTLQEAGYCDSEFDFISLHHVIEHVVDPAGLVREAGRILKPGGRFLVRTPCCDSLPAILAGQDWFYDPDHIYFFSQASLRALLERNGFRLLNAMSTVGIQYETWSETWNTARLNPAIRELIERFNQGDVVIMLAECVKP